MTSKTEQKESKKKKKMRRKKITEMKKMTERVAPALNKTLLTYSFIANI